MELPRTVINQRYSRNHKFCGETMNMLGRIQRKCILKVSYYIIECVITLLRYCVVYYYTYNILLYHVLFINTYVP